MNLYKISRPDPDQIGYDECAGFVIQAEDEPQARTRAAAHCGDEGPGIWEDSNYSTVQIVASRVKALAFDVAPDGIVLTDFRAG